MERVGEVLVDAWFWMLCWGVHAPNHHCMPVP